MCSYIVILDGCAKVYEDEKASIDNPQDVIMTIPLGIVINTNSEHPIFYIASRTFPVSLLVGDSYHASAIKRKNYSTEKIVEFHCFYIEEWGPFMALRKLKIGCLNRDTADKLIKAIDINTRSLDEEVV